PAPWQVSGTAATGARQRAGVPAGAAYASTQPFDLVRNFCTSKKIACCDLSPAFRKHAQPDSLFLQKAIAFSRDGQVLYARELARFLVENIPGPWGRTPETQPRPDSASAAARPAPDAAEQISPAHRRFQ